MHSATFADGQLTDAIKHIASDPSTDARVRKKLVSVLASWHRQFEGDPKMSLVANLYRSVPHSRPTPRVSQQEVDNSFLAQQQKHEAKMKAKQAKEEGTEV